MKISIWLLFLLVSCTLSAARHRHHKHKTSTEKRVGCPANSATQQQPASSRSKSTTQKQPVSLTSNLTQQQPVSSRRAKTKKTHKALSSKPKSPNQQQPASSSRAQTRKLIKALFLRPKSKTQQQPASSSRAKTHKPHKALSSKPKSPTQQQPASSSRAQTRKLIKKLFLRPKSPTQQQPASSSRAQTRKELRKLWGQKQELIKTMHKVLASTNSTKVEWSYSGANGPKNWKSMKGNEKCGGMDQSPINLSKARSTYLGKLKRKQFHYSGYSTPVRSMELFNNGHSAQVNLGGKISIRGGGLKGKYIAAQFHFHWGSASCAGSEHTINSKRYPMEMHIVHYSSKYPNAGKAMNKAKGLAVLGFMFRVTKNDNPKLKTLIKGLKKIPYKGDNTRLKPFSLDKILPKSRSHFFRYKGSLTTPPCYESVVWTVFSRAIPISERQLNAFRSLNADARESKHKKHGKIVNNYRPLQFRKNREVLVNWR